ncbi:hypothetical protein EXS71_03820 [Candidatus Uhrbacteria bacterium]|nr:hypothetical protein [Candidatus Uhrbacteria bacterium]
MIKQLPIGHYRVHLTYAPFPSLADLKKELGKNRVSDLFDGQHKWELHASRVGIDRMPGKQTFFLNHIGRDWNREEQIAWGLAQHNTVAPNGYLTVTHEEAYEFLKAHPEFDGYIALGSSTLSEDGQYVVGFVNNGLCAFDSRWLINDKFPPRHFVLFVSK